MLSQKKKDFSISLCTFNISNLLYGWILALLLARRGPNGRASQSIWVILLPLLSSFYLSLLLPLSLPCTPVFLSHSSPCPFSFLNSWSANSTSVYLLPMSIQLLISTRCLFFTYFSYTFFYRHIYTTKYIFFFIKVGN